MKKVLFVCTHNAGRSQIADRDHRRGRARRALRRPDHRRLDDPCTLARARARGGQWTDVWLYVAGPLIGAAIGVSTYELVRGAR